MWKQMDQKQRLGPVAFCVAMVAAAFTLGGQAVTAAPGVSVDLGLGDVIKEIRDWVYYKPTPDSPEEVRERVPLLATKLATLAGLNSSLASALLADGPANTKWMYQSLYKTREEVRGIFDLIDHIDPDFGAKNNHLVSELTGRMNEKVGLLDKYDQHIDLNSPQVRQSLGKALEAEAKVMQDLSDKIAAALQKQ